MDAQCQDTFKRSRGCMSIGDTFFDRPWTPACCFTALAHGKGSILMPYNQPVRRWRFIEQGGRIGIAPGPSILRAMFIRWESFANSRTAGMLIACRAPALVCLIDESAMS